MLIFGTGAQEHTRRYATDVLHRVRGVSFCSKVHVAEHISFQVMARCMVFLPWCGCMLQHVLANMRKIYIQKLNCKVHPSQLVNPESVRRRTALIDTRKIGVQLFGFNFSIQTMRMVVFSVYVCVCVCMCVCMCLYVCAFVCVCLFFTQQQNFAMGSSAQVCSGAIRCSFNTRFQTRFRRVPVQILREVPEGSSAGRRLQCRYLVRFYREFWCSYLMRFRRVYR